MAAKKKTTRKVASGSKKKSASRKKTSADSKADQQDIQPTASDSNEQVSGVSAAAGQDATTPAKPTTAKGSRTKKASSSKKKASTSRKTSTGSKSASKSKGTSSRSATSRKSGGDNGDGQLVEPPEPVKTTMTDEQLAHFRELLLIKRKELTGDLEGMRETALRNSRSESAGDLSAMPIHMADIGSDNYEQEFTLGLLQNETATMTEIDEALARIENKTYGMCLATGKPIAESRLEVIPWAKYCIEYVRENEKSRRHR